MPLTNAQKQQRWKERNQVALSADAETIAGKMMRMADQAKLRKVVAYLKEHIRHPDRTEEERLYALGQFVIPTLNGLLTKRRAIEYLRKNPQQPQDHSWLVEATTKDGKRWRNGVRLKTKQEAETYIESHASFELEEDGYLTGQVVRCDGEQANCTVFRNRGRPTLLFAHGQCGLREWHALGNASVIGGTCSPDLPKQTHQQARK